MSHLKPSTVINCTKYANQIGLLDHVPCGEKFVINLNSSSWRVSYSNSSKQSIFFPHAFYKMELRRTLNFSQMVVKSRKSLTYYLNASVLKKTHVLLFSNLPRFAQKMRFKIMCFNSYAFLAITSEEIGN
jgi:hypothetical protein